LGKGEVAGGIECVCGNAGPEGARGCEIGCGEDAVTCAGEAASAVEDEIVCEDVSSGDCGWQRSGDIGIRGISGGVGGADAIVKGSGRSGNVGEIGDARGDGTNECVRSIVS